MRSPKLLASMALAAGVCALAAAPASAFFLDLTSAGASGSIGYGYFVQVNDQPTGTGVIDPFLRVQKNHTERGVNSDGPYLMDEKTGTWTHALKVGDFGVVDNGGTPSIRLLLDINQTSHDPLLSMDRLKIYAAPSKDYNNLADLAAHADLLYDMGSGNGVYLNYNLASGSGSGDMLAYLPYDLFSSHQDDYFYLFSEFGASGGSYWSNAGFEEWSRVDGAVTPVPEPASLVLLAGGLLGAGLARRRRGSK